MSHIRYELFCVDNRPIDPEAFEPRVVPLSGVTWDNLGAAHDMAHVMLRRFPNGCDSYLYKGGLNRIELPVYTSNHAYADFSLERLEPKPLLAIAEVCATLRCILRPLDGGPDVPADPQAIAQDLSRRAMAALRPAGTSWFEVADAAAHAAREARSLACANARAIREAHVKRRKPANVASPMSPVCSTAQATY